MANRPVQKKKNKRTVSPFTVLLLVTAVLTVLAVALLVYQNFDADTGGKTLIKDERAGDLLFSLEDNTGSNLYAFGTTRLLSVEQSKVELLNLSGSVEDSVVETLGTPTVVILHDVAVVYDQGGFNYHYFTKNGLRFSAETADPIESLSLSHDGKIALILDRDKTNGVLRVLDADGDLLMEWLALDAQNSGYIIMSAFAEDSSFIDVSLLNTNRSNPISLVNRFSLEAGRVGERIGQYQMTAESPVMSIVDQGEKTAFITDRQITTNDQGKILQAASFAMIQSVSAGDSGLAVLAQETVGGRMGLYYLNDLAQAKAGTALELSDEAGEPVSSGRYTAIADGEKIWIVKNGQTGQAISYDMKSTVLSIAVDTNGYILSVCRDDVRRIVP